VTPCRLSVPDGARLALSVLAGTAAPWSRTWIVARDAQLRLSRAADQLVLDEGADDSATRAADTARAAATAAVPAQPRGRRRRAPRKPSATTSTATPPAKVDKPVTAPDKPQNPAAPKQVGAGTMDF
jgi:hypothetical protein